MKGKELGGQNTFGASLINLLHCYPTQNAAKILIPASPHFGRTQYERILVSKQGLWGPSGHCSAQIIIYRCQRQWQISHTQPEIFTQEPSNAGFAQKPQVGVNISIASLYDIYIVYVSSWSDDSNVRCRHLLWSHLHVRVQVEKQLKEGRENDTAKVSPKCEGVSSLCIQAKPLSLPLGLEYLPTVFKSCIYQVTASKECIFSFSWR